MTKKRKDHTVEYSMECAPKVAAYSGYYNINNPPPPHLNNFQPNNFYVAAYQPLPIIAQQNNPLSLVQPQDSFMSSTGLGEEEIITQQTIATYFKREPLNPIHSSYFAKIQVLKKEDFKIGCANLVLGYFNKYLNQIQECLFSNVDELDLKCNFDKDDQKKVWHAETIGAGGFGTVLKVTKRNSLTKEIEETRAIKIIPNQTMGVSEAIKGAKLNNNPNVVQVTNVLMIRNICCLEMENIEHGSLETLIKRDFCLSSQCIHKILMQCCEVLLLMKSYKMVHSDIKPDNIMVKNLKSDDFDIAIGDFGFSLLCDSLDENLYGGTTNYLAPELKQQMTQKTFNPTFASDIFALGKSLQQLKVDDMFWIPYIKGFTSTDPRDRLNSFYSLGIFECLLNKHINTIWTNDLDFLTRMLELSGRSAHSFLIKFGFPLQLTKVQRKNKQFLLDFNLYDYADESLKEDENFIMDSIAKNEQVFKSIDESKKDYDFILKAVSINGNVLEFVNEASKKDMQIVLKATTQCAASFKFADETLKRNHDSVLKCVENNANVFEFVYSEFKNDFGIVSIALRKNRKLLKFVNPLTKYTIPSTSWGMPNKIILYTDLIIEALCEDDNIPIFQSKLTELKQDMNQYYSFAMNAVVKQPKLLDLIDITLRTSINFIYNAVIKNEMVITYADEQFMKKKELALLMLDNELVFQYLPEHFKNDRAFIIEAVKRNGHVYFKTNEQFKNDYEIVFEAVKCESICDFNFNWMKNKEFYQSEQFVLEAVKKGLPFSSIPDSLKCHRRSFIKESLKYHKPTFYKEFENDKEMVLAFFEGIEKYFVWYKKQVPVPVWRNELRQYLRDENKELFYYYKSMLSSLTLNFIKDKDVVLQALKCGANIKYVPDLQHDREFLLKLAEKCVDFTDESINYFGNIAEKELALEIVKRNATCFHFLEKNFQEDYDIVLARVKMDGRIVGIIKDKTILLESIRRIGFEHQRGSNEREIILLAVKANGLHLTYADEFVSDEEIVWEAINQNGMALQFADPKFKKNRDYVKAAVLNCRDVLLNLVDESFKLDNEIITLPQKVYRNGKILTL